MQIQHSFTTCVNHFTSIAEQLRLYFQEQEIELCRLIIVLLAYIASSGKLGYEVLLGPVSGHGANFLELIMQVLASQMQYETQELLKERYLLCLAFSACWVIPCMWK